MPVLIAYNKKKHNNTLDIGKKQVILVHMCFSDKCETIERWRFLKHYKKYFLGEENQLAPPTLHIMH